MKFNPHDYQKFCIDFIIDNPKAGLLLDMGLGKTAATLMALSILEEYYLEIDKVLIIAPKRVAQYTWPNEIDKWNEFKGITYSVVIGTEKQRLEALDRDVMVYLINRENVEWLYKYLSKVKKRFFDTIVIDESSSFKNPGSKRFKALKKMAVKTPRLLILTGTPAPNGLMDLWSQIYLLDQGQRLGRTLTEYRNRYFNPGRRNGHVIFDWTVKPEAEEKIYTLISDIVVSMKSVDHLKMPERIDNNIELEMSDRVERLYNDLKKDFILKLEDDVITAATAGVLCNKLLQLSNGALYKSNGTYEVIHNYKLKALEEILENNPEIPILVFYNYKSDLDRLKAYFKLLEPKTLDEPNALEDWNNKKIRLLLANPQSMGHGLNMQAGGNIIVWFGLTFNLELYQQANARLYRQGQKNTVVIHHLILKKSEDEVIMERLSQKNHIQNSLIDYVKAEIRRIKKNGKID